MRRRILMGSSLASVRIGAIALMSGGLVLSAAVTPLHAAGGFKASQVDGIEVKVGDAVVWSNATFLSPASIRGYFYSPESRKYIEGAVYHAAGVASGKLPKGVSLVRQKFDLSPGCAPEMLYGPRELGVNVLVPRSIFFTNVTTPGPLGQGADPRFSVDFDAAGSAIISIPTQADGAVTVSSIRARVYNIKPSGQNFTGDLALAVGKLVADFKGVDLAAELSKGLEFSLKPIKIELGKLSRVLSEKGQTQKVEQSYDPGRRMLVLEISAAPPRNNRPITKLKITPTTQAPTASTPDPAPSTPLPSKSTAPAITANPRTVSIPAGQSEGTTTLTWDGGSEHPYAEVWVKVGDEDEKFVVEQGKGSRAVKVGAGKTYLYILTDSGKRLATVAVTGK